MFEKSVLCGNFENMEWLLGNNCSRNFWTFAHVAKNENLENVKWLLENNYPGILIHLQISIVK